MSEIARLSFGHPDHPAEQGALILSDTGFVRLEPSEELRDALAEREDAALTAANIYGTRLGLALMAAGLAAIAAGWYAGRVWGKWAGQLLVPRPASQVFLSRRQDGALNITLGKIQWTAGECSASAAEEFSRKLKETQDDL